MEIAVEVAGVVAGTMIGVFGVLYAASAIVTAAGFLLGSGETPEED